MRENVVSCLSEFELFYLIATITTIFLKNALTS